jgi:ergothioneine biosynthesis protein EgtB
MTLDTQAKSAWGESAWAKADTLADRYHEVRRFTMALCEPLELEDYVAQSMTEASPTKWHIAHTTWFFETFVLERYDESYRPFHPQYSFLFNSYYNAVGERVARPIRGLMTRPTVADVRRYREHVDEAILALLERAKGPAFQRARSLIEIGLQHEQQHQELILIDLKHLLSLNSMRPVYRPSLERSGPTEAGPMHWIGFDEGIYRIGHEGDEFAWDNESPRHRVFLNRFQIGDRLVTNREYLAFMADGGYERPELWLDEGWATVQANGWKAPRYWERDGDDWKHFTLSGMRSLDPEEPVCHVSFYEAHAFAWWTGARLPTESEWEIAAAERPIEGNFVEQQRCHPAICAQDESGAVRQAFGDAWEWTQSAYRPYPGYRAAEGALGEYNGKFMCNQFVLRGGSCVTPQSHVRSTYRNFFHAPARWVVTGIRLARDA